MRKYYKHYKRMDPITKVTMWVERGYMKPPKDYNLIKLFPYKYYPEDVLGHVKKVKLDMKDPFNKLKVEFMKKYPEHIDTYINKNYRNPRLMDSFVNKQFNLMKQGFNQMRAFELVEKEMSSNIQAEKFDRLLLEREDISDRSRSLMNVFEQREEFVQQQKVRRLERDLPEFLRSEYNKTTDPLEIRNNMISRYNSENNLYSEGREDKFLSNKPYDPVTYYITNKKNQEDNGDDDETKKKFLERSESLINYYHAVSEISDGLSNFPEKEILRLANNSTRRFKHHFSKLLKKLQKNNVKLNMKGFIDLDKIESHLIKDFVKKNLNICTVVLLAKDLDFEIPHQQRMNEIKQDILGEIKTEQERLINIFSEREEEKIRLLNQKELSTSYEDIFGIPINCKFIYFL